VKLVRVVAPHFVAGFETDGVVRRTAPILKVLRGWTDERARKYIQRKGWKASVMSQQMKLELGEYDQKRKMADACLSQPTGGSDPSLSDLRRHGSERRQTVCHQASRANHPGPFQLPD